jgi:CDP-diacylglycerol--serine O-phosphatidyltransferase
LEEAVQAEILSQDDKETTSKSNKAKPVARKKKFGRLNMSIIPNSCTSMNLVCGYLAIIMTSRGEFLAASWLILIANIFDILDGRLARLASVESKFGAELDSLCDLISFGVAPAFLVYTRYLEGDRIFSFLITAVFVLCGALRLARFNVTPHSKQGVFEGLPIPGAAGLLATMTIFDLQFGSLSLFTVPARLVPFVVLISSFLMVSRIEYPAIKKTPKTSNTRIIVVMLAVMALLLYPAATLFVVVWGFALYGLVAALIKNGHGLYKKLKERRLEPEA